MIDQPGFLKAVILTKHAGVAGLLTMTLLAPRPVFAQSRFGVGTVFSDAALLCKLLMLTMVVAAIAAIIITVKKLSSGHRLQGGSSFISALRLGGPLIGLLGAVFNLMVIFIGIANAGEPALLAVLSPGFAEAAMLFFIGLFAGVIAVTCHWIIEARIDRTVLSS